MVIKSDDEECGDHVYISSLLKSLDRWRSALIWRSFFTTAVVAVVLRLFIELCGNGRCGMFGQGGLIMYDVSTLFDNLMTYHLKDIPTVILIGVTGALLGGLYNFLMIKVLRVYTKINEYDHPSFTFFLLLFFTCPACEGHPLH